MAAVAAFWPTTGRLEAMAAFPALPDLAERGRTDGADYGRMHRDGDLLILGRRTVPVADLIDGSLDRWGTPARIVATTTRSVSCGTRWTMPGARPRR